MWLNSWNLRNHKKNHEDSENCSWGFLMVGEDHLGIVSPNFHTGHFLGLFANKCCFWTSMSLLQFPSTISLRHCFHIQISDWIFLIASGKLTIGMTAQKMKVLPIPKGPSWETAIDSPFRYWSFSWCLAWDVCQRIGFGNLRLPHFPKKGGEGDGWVFRWVTWTFVEVLMSLFSIS